MKVLDTLPHVFTENAEDFNKLHDYIKTSEEWGKVVDRLKERIKTDDRPLIVSICKSILGDELDY